MDGRYDIECTNRGQGGIAGPIITAAIGIPHLLVGLLVTIFASGDGADVAIAGIGFICSGSICLIVGIFLALSWLNRKMVVKDDGLEYTNRFGRTVFYPWDEVRITDLNEDSGKLVFELKGKKTSFSQSAKGYLDMRSSLKARGKLLRKDGRRLPSRSGKRAETVGEEKLF